MKLLLRPKLLTDEGPHGYLLRLASVNVLRYDQLKNRGAIRPDENPNLPPQLIGELLDANGWQKQYGREARWNQTAPRACPLCLRSAEYWRLLWELEFYDVCHVHKVNLIDQCSICHEKFSWRRISMAGCSCGASILNEAVQKSSDSLEALSELIAAKWNKNNIPDRFEFLDALNLFELQKLIHLFGAYAAFSGNKRPQKVIDVRSLQVSWHITSYVAEVFLQWPKGFHRLLDHIQSFHRRESARLPERFGYFYHALYKELSGASFNCIRDEFQRYLNHYWDAPLSKRNRRLSVTSTEQFSWMLATDAQRELGVSRQRIEMLIAEERLKAREYRGDSGRSVLMVNRYDVEQISQWIKKEIDLRTAAEILGLCRSRLENILTLLFPDAFKLCKGAAWAIPGESIERILNVCSELKERHYLMHHEVSVRDVLQFWQWTDKEVALMINDVVSKKISPVALLQGERGIAGWIMDRKEINHWAGNNKPSRINFTIPEVAERLGVKQEVAYFWVRANILPTVPDDKSNARVSVAGLKTFTTDHVLAEALARACNTSSRSLVEKLSRLSVAPLSGPRIDGCRQILFRREPALFVALKEVFPDSSLKKWSDT